MTHDQAREIMSVYNAVERYQPIMRTDALFSNTTRIAECSLEELHTALDMHHASMTRGEGWGGAPA